MHRLADSNHTGQSITILGFKFHNRKSASSTTIKRHHSQEKQKKDHYCMQMLYVI